jgi:hypothetical protein
VVVVLTVYCWLLFLYPGTYRDDFGEEMTCGFCEARSELPPALAAKISFYRREFCGLLLGTLCAHFDRLFGPAIPFWRSFMQPQFPFSRSTVLASSVAGDTLRIGLAVIGIRSGFYAADYVHRCRSRPADSAHAAA